MKKMIAGALSLAMMAMVLPAGAAQKISLPKGYEKWEKSKEKIVTDKNSLFYGIHYIYLDNKTMKIYKSGGKYPEGSQFVVLFYNIKTEGGKPTKGKKNMVVLMKKDKRQKATGGWLFAGFTPEGKHNATLDPVKTCFECHLKDAAATDFVISKYSDFK